MKVKDLIEKLQNEDENKDIYIAIKKPRKLVKTAPYLEGTIDISKHSYECVVIIEVL